MTLSFLRQLAQLVVDGEDLYLLKQTLGLFSHSLALLDRQIGEVHILSANSPH